MKIAELLRSKGDFLATIRPEAPVTEALADLDRHGIGALVVSSDGLTADGIVSERDIVRRLHAYGPAILDRPVSMVMSTEVRCCSPDDEVESLMATMTTHRVRHLPVEHDGRLVGIISIGDVVKHRIDELEGDRRLLYDYINAR